MYASRGKHVQKRQEQNKIAQSPKNPVKSKLNTQKTFKTLENEWKPRNTPVVPMEEANNTPRKTESKKKSQNAENKSQNNSPSFYHKSPYK
jgi:hypothetical protein